MQTVDGYRYLKFLSFPCSLFPGLATNTKLRTLAHRGNISSLRHPAKWPACQTRNPAVPGSYPDLTNTVLDLYHSSSD